MLGSIQSERCNLAHGLVFPRASWLRADPGSTRSRRDWAMDSHFFGSVWLRHVIVFSLVALWRCFPWLLASLGCFAATAGPARLLLEGLVDFCPTPEVMEQNRQLARHCDERSLLGVLAAAGGHLQSEPTQVTVQAKWPEDVVSGIDQQSSQEGITFFGDAHLRVRLARALPAGNQSQERTDCPALAKSLRVLDGQDKGQRDDRPDTANLPQKLRLRVALLGHRLQPPFQSLDRLSDRSNRLDHGEQARLQRLRDRFGDPLLERWARTVGKSPPQRLHQASHVVDQQSSRPH